MENDLVRVVDAVVDTLPGLVWTAFPDGQVNFLNRRWSEYTGLVADRALGHGWQAAIHPEDLPRLLERWHAILASEEQGEMEARLRRFDGAYRWFLFRLAPLTDSSGHLVKWCGVNTDIEERKCVEETLHEQERRFGLILDGLPAHVNILTPEGRPIHVNRQYREYVGATLEEQQRWAIGHSFHPDDRASGLAAWRKSIETGAPYDFDGRRRRVDGAYRWFNLRAYPLRDAEGRIVLWYSAHIDIDDRKRAETLLAGERRLLEMVAAGRSMPVILEALCQLVETTVSGCCCSVVLVGAGGTRLEQGASPSLPASFITSIIGRRVDLDSSPCAMATHLNQQVIAADIASETRWATHAWSSIALANKLRACWSTPICATTGKVLGAFAIYHDEPRTPTSNDQTLIEQITHIASVAIERTQSDATLKRSEAFLSATRRLSSFGGFSKRVSTGDITWSAEVYRLFELDPGEPVTLERILTRVHPEDVPSFQAMLDRQQRGSDYEHEYRLLMPDRSVKYLHVVAHATRDLDGQLEYLATVQDVTQRRLSEEALAKARSELARVARVTTLGALTASIAHEVNQPLSGIITNASTCLRMLASDPPNLDGARETARRTIRDGNRASDVIKRLRALFANKDAATELVDLNEASREVIALLRSELQRNRVVLQTELADDLPTITGDRIQLQQVILNLLLNASEAMSSVDDRPRSLVTQTGRDEGDRVFLSVRDAGVGIEPQATERLFDAFYTTKSDGMGIGLSVSRSIVENHHGRLWATPNDGPGTTFTFSIPRHPGGVKGAHSRGAHWTAGVIDTQPVVRNS
jgi:PAS domain S-box-containing protein